MPSPAKDHEIVVDGKKYWQVNTHTINYSVSIHKSSQVGSLVDHGANGDIARGDVHVTEKTGCSMDVWGIDNHQIVDIPIITAKQLPPPSEVPLSSFSISMPTLARGRQSTHRPNSNGFVMTSMTNPPESQVASSAFSPMTDTSSPSA